MAEGENWLQRLNPITAIRDRFSGFRDHPIQSSLSALLGLGASAVGGPLAGAAVNRGLGAFFGNRNEAQFNEGAQQLQSDTGARLNDQIWGQWQPQDSRPGSTTGGMAGITSPYSPRQPAQTAQNGQGALLQMLGIQGYGSSPQGPSQPTPGYAGGHNQYTGQAGSNFVGPGPNENTAGYGPSGSSSVGNLGANGSLGSSAGSATMSDIENMLSAGLGRGNPYRGATQRREVNSTRAELQAQGIQRLPGQSVQDYLRQ